MYETVQTTNRRSSYAAAGWQQGREGTGIKRMSTQQQIARPGIAVPGDSPVGVQGAAHGAGAMEIPHGDPVKPHSAIHGEDIHLPKPTPWPIVTAFGFTLLIAGILTHYVISIMGGLLLIYGCVGWFKDVLPHEAHENIEVKVQEIAIASSRKSVSRISTTPEHRSTLPMQTFSIGTGLKGGVAGGIAMIIPALAYGLIAQHSIWYPINLLGGAGVAGWRNPSVQDLRAFHAEALAVAVLIHSVSCVLIGLLYGSILPLMPKHPILLGGVIAPLAWSGLLFATLPTINPELSQHINWADFLISQLTFGLVAGYVVSRSEYIRTAQNLPLAMRLGLESPGLTAHDTDQDSGDRH